MTIHKIKFDFLCGEPHRYESLLDCNVDIDLPEGVFKIKRDILLNQIASIYNIDIRANPMCYVDGRSWKADPHSELDSVIPDRTGMIDLLLLQSKFSNLSVQIYKLPDLSLSYRVSFFDHHPVMFEDGGSLATKASSSKSAP